MGQDDHPALAVRALEQRAHDAVVVRYPAEMAALRRPDLGEERVQRLCLGRSEAYGRAVCVFTKEEKREPEPDGARSSEDHGEDDAATARHHGRTLGRGQRDSAWLFLGHRGCLLRRCASG